MEILSREELMELQGIGNGTYSGLSDDEAKSIISTALALMDERDKMKAGRFILLTSPAQDPTGYMLNALIATINSLH